MLSRLGAAVGDAVTGHGDNCAILSKASEIQAEVTLLSYILPDEKAIVILKSAKEEYIFTDTAFISVKGSTNVGTKRHVIRYDYCESFFDKVCLRTPGLVSLDMDGGLSFLINGELFDIDIRKPEWEEVKPLYRALTTIQRAQGQNKLALQLQKEMFPGIQLHVTDAKVVLDLAFALGLQSVNKYNPISYRGIWQLFYQF